MRLGLDKWSYITHDVCRDDYFWINVHVSDQKKCELCGDNVYVTIMSVLIHVL